MNENQNQSQPQQPDPRRITTLEDAQRILERVTRGTASGEEVERFAATTREELNRAILRG